MLLVVGLILQSQTLSIDIGAASVTECMRQISVATNLRVAATGEVRNATLALHLSNRPRDKAFESIATALQCEWTQSGDRVTFFLSPKKRAEQVRSESETRRQEIRDALSQAPSAGPLDEAKAKSLAFRLSAVGESLGRTIPSRDQRDLIGKLRSEGPGDQLLRSVLEKCDQSVLAGLVVGEAVAWSNKPNRLQKPLPGVAPALDTYEHGYTLVRRELAGSLNTNPSVNPEDPRRAYDAEPERPVRIVLLVRRSPRSLLADASVIGASGTELSHPFLILPIKETPDDSYKPGWEPLAPSPKWTALLKLLSKPWSEADGGLRKELASPLTIDPLALVHGHLLSQVAERERCDVVASIPDLSLPTTFESDLSELVKPLSARDFAKKVQADWGCRVLRREDCLVFTPARPVESRLSYLDRSALNLLYGEYARDRRLSLETAAAYAIRQSGALRFRYERIVCSVFARAANNVSDLDMISPWSGAVLALWSACGNLEGEIAESQLDSKAAAEAERILLRRDLTLSDPSSSRPFAPDVTEVLGSPNRSPLTFNFRVFAFDVLFRRYADRPFTEDVDNCYGDIDKMDDQGFFVASARRLNARVQSGGLTSEQSLDELPKFADYAWQPKSQLAPEVVRRLRNSYAKQSPPPGSLSPRQGKSLK